MVEKTPEDSGNAKKPTEEVKKIELQSKSIPESQKENEIIISS
jgi:hypothetical protein